MSTNCKLTHALSDAEFDVFYSIDVKEMEVDIVGLYLINHHQDLIDIISDEVMDELKNDIIYEVEGL